MNQLQPNRTIQMLTIIIFIVLVAAASLDIFNSPAGLDKSNIARIALPLSALCLLLAEYPRFKMTAARIPLFAIGGVLGIAGVYFAFLSRLL
jgi:hypothetical protein